jgi:peroxiredoxin
LQEDKLEFDSHDAIILAISVDTPEKTKEKLFAKIQVSFPILSDSKLEITKKYGVLDTDVGNIALPSVFVVDKQGIIRWFKIGESKRDRPENDELIKILMEINEK